MRPDSDSTRQAADDLLPLFEETLRTLDVLFPAWDPSTMDFVDDLSGNSNITSSFKLMDLYPQQPQGLTKFKFWRARLTELIVEHQSPAAGARVVTFDANHDRRAAALASHSANTASLCSPSRGGGSDARMRCPFMRTG